MHRAALGCLVVCGCAGPFSSRSRSSSEPCLRVDGVTHGIERLYKGGREIGPTEDDATWERALSDHPAAPHLREQLHRRSEMDFKASVIALAVSLVGATLAFDALGKHDSRLAGIGFGLALGGPVAVAGISNVVEDRVVGNPLVDYNAWATMHGCR
jgi:hypothetical protein